MTGASRPPWVDLQEFYRMPFNYCDRWCEKCKLCDLCKIFREEQESKKDWIAAGKDPDSWEYVFYSVSDSLKEAFMLLAKQAEELGIDLNKIDYNEKEEEPPPKIFNVYKLVNKFFNTIRNLLKDFEVVPVDVDKDLVIRHLDTLSFYSTLVSAKIYRATTSKFREEKDLLMKECCGDSRISAYIAVNSMDEVIAALTELISHPPLRPMREKLIKFKKSAINLKEVINIEFEVEEEKLVN